MSTVALVGAQWGDEGKGKVIDILASKADMVVRAQGGNNAGHTVVTGGVTYKLRLIPSGILYKNCDCMIGGGTVVDPKALLEEMNDISSKGIDLSNLKIDERAHVILPYHLRIDELSEKSRGAGDIGTTKKGIGPCYMDKSERSGIRMCDFINPSVFKEKLQKNIENKNMILSRIYESQELDFEEIYNEYVGYAKKLEKFVCDTSVLVYEAIKADKSVLFEGAQGALLDLDVGTYPYVTSSHPTSGGFCIGAGVGPTLIKECLGIAKAYTTRVGKGPFPTELDNEIGEHIRKVGAEFGTVTGRARRCGWLDLVILRYAVRVNSLTCLAVNKLDTLSGIENLKVCVAYEKNGKTVHHFPADIAQLAECTPIYVDMPGWKEDISAVQEFQDLPENARKYVEFIEKNTGCPVTMIGVGPDRHQNFNRSLPMGKCK